MNIRMLHATLLCLICVSPPGALASAASAGTYAPLSAVQGEHAGGNPDPSTLVDRAFEALHERRFSEAASLLEGAGDDATAHYLLGCMYEFGSLGRADVESAREHYGSAAGLHCTDAALALVRLERAAGAGGELKRWLYQAFKLGHDDSALELADLFSRSSRAGDHGQAIAWAKIAEDAGVEGAHARVVALADRFPKSVRGAESRRRMIERKLERDRRSVGGLVQIQVPREMFLPEDLEGGGAGAPSPARSDFDAADALYTAGEYAAALAAFLPLAEAGDGAAAFYVGRIHEMGYAGARNPVEAERWYERASDLGIGAAMENLGLMILQGRGSAKDPVRATDLLIRAAFAGNRGGATNIGFAYLTGQGRPKDLVEGWAWTSIAADLDQERATNNLRIGEGEMTAAQKARARTRKAELLNELQGKPQPQPQPQPQPKPQGRVSTTSVRMQKVPLRDELMENMESHTLLLPESWDLAGGVTWNPLSTWAFVSVDARASAPDGRHVQFFPNGSFTYNEGTDYPGAPVPPAIGQMTGGKMFLPPGQGPVDFLAQTLFPAYHPGATNFEVVSVQEVEEVARQYRELFAPLIQEAEAMNQRAASSSGMRTSVKVGVPMIRVRYSEAGQSFEEQFTFMYYRMEFGGEMGMGISMRVFDWSVYDVRGLRAPAGQLDTSLAMLLTVSNSLTPTRPWKAIVDELQKRVIRNQMEISRMQHQTNMQNLAALRKRGETLRKANAEIMEQNQASWERSQASQDRLSHAWSNTMLGVDDYTLPDGSVRSLDSSYDHVYTSGGDGFLFTNDANLDPNIGSTVEWQRIEPIAPAGGAANR